VPVKGGQFTVQELEFIGFCADTGNAVRAAELAGYSRPDIAATRLSYRPEVQAAIRAKVSARVAVEGAPAALACLISIVRDENAPKAPRVQASKVLLDLDREQSGAAGSGGALSEMSRAQLDEAREKAIAYIRSLDAPPVLDLVAEPEPAPGLFD
jgi:phage terminase small subunit